MRIKIDREGLVQCAYIYLTDNLEIPVDRTLNVPVPKEVPAMINIDFKGGKMVGIEVVGAEILPDDLLAIAEDYE